MGKLLGYILAGLGLVGIALGSETGLSLVPLSFIQNINPNFILYPGVVLTVLGIVILIINSNKSGKTPKEVPIYKGKEIVGYRRHK